jgi:transcriptional regulator with XRE-family HTH domain
MIRVSDPEHIGPALADMRAMTKLSRRQVAEAVGMHEAQYGQYELGHRAPSLTTLVKLLGVFGYRIALVPLEDA